LLAKGKIIRIKAWTSKLVFKPIDINMLWQRQRFLILAKSMKHMLSFITMPNLSLSKHIQASALFFLAITSSTLAHARYQYQTTPVTAPDLERKISRRGKASWYSERDPGINRRTANNELFNDSELTCAMWGVPFNQEVKVTNLANGKSVTVRVNDRGPHKRFVRRGRIIDLSRGAFAEIAPLRHGLIDIEIEFL
jgi:rare lipoprotein A